jgi:hypothetical protein
VRRRDLKLPYLLSIAVALVLTVVSLGGLIDGNRVYPGVDKGLLTLFVGQDALNLLVGLPILLGSMWLARRGSLVGLLLWPGALFYVLYDYGYYALGSPFNAFFIPYLALMTLSAYAMIGIVTSLRTGAVRDELIAAVPARITGGFMTGLAVLFVVLWTAMSVSVLASGGQLELVPRIVTIMDLTVQLPALLLGGILLWRREAFGYVVAAGLLLQAAAYLIGLSVISALQELVLNQPIDPVAVIPGIAVGAVALVLIGPFVRGAAGRGKPARESPTSLVASAATR